MVHLDVRVPVGRMLGWVFTDLGATFLTQAAPDGIVVNAINEPTRPALSDITTGSKAARVYYSVDADSPTGGYGISLDPELTAFASGDPNRSPEIPVHLSDCGVVVYVPEPAGPAALGAAELIAVLRRRPRQALRANRRQPG